MNRKPELDIVKTVAVTAMVVGHSLLEGSPLRCFIYSFHMPCFFLISGFLFKEEQLCAAIKKSFFRLIRPFVITLSAIIFIHAIMQQWPTVMSKVLGLVYPSSVATNPSVFRYANVGVLWFLPAMFFCRIYFNLIFRYAHKHYLIVALSLTLVCGYVGKYIFNLPFGMLMGACGMGYFGVGKYVSDNRDSFFKLPLWLWVLVAIPFVYLGVKFSMGMSYFSYMKRAYPLSIIVACFWSLFLYRLACTFGRYIGGGYLDREKLIGNIVCTFNNSRDHVELCSRFESTNRWCRYFTEWNHFGWRNVFIICFNR
ncbi:MAG: acyltransferase family protein [Bacteroidia bacterium]|nr:acyltransferase family protein [Bacteroidia bacterium]